MLICLRVLSAKVLVTQVLVVWGSNIFLGFRSKYRHNTALDVTYILILEFVNYLLGFLKILLKDPIVIEIAEPVRTHLLI